MTLAMALDNSFEIMNEDEMYDVNGGAWVSIVLSKDFVRDLITASLSAIGAIIGGALGSVVPILGTSVCAAIGASLGWIIGGAIARGAIRGDGDYTSPFKIFVPFRKKDIKIY